jgi:mannose-6-phosphate isomerase-like protein (cupin superfamily)
MKDEVTYIVSGTMIVRYDLEDGKGLREKTLEAGQWIRFPTGMVHQEEAVTDVVRLEASSPFLNDRVRVEEKYGLPFDGGLPTTSIDEIIKI